MDGLPNPKEIHIVSSVAKETPPEHKGGHPVGRIGYQSSRNYRLAVGKTVWRASRTLIFVRSKLVVEGPVCAGK